MPDEIKYDGFPIESSKMKEVFREVADYAKQGYPVVLFGPSGSGKEFLARHYFDIYMTTQNERGRFESINCATLSDGTTAGDLFGYEKGIFTSAYKDKEGLLEKLTTGVLFLDEVGDLNESIQPMLLRALHTNRFKREGRRIGAHKGYKIDPRLCIICATEKPVETIRESLLYRMGAIIHVPGMEQRPEDVKSALPWLLNHAVKAIRNSKAIQHRLNSYPNGEITSWTDFSVLVSKHLLPLVESREWNGNFRSLNAVITQSVIRSADSANYNELTDNVIRHFQAILPNYSKSGHHSQILSLKIPETARTEKHSETESRMQEIVKIFPRIAPKEAVKIAEFLVNYSSIDFRRTDFESFTSVYKTARTAQKRLRELVNHNLLAEKEKGIYCVKNAQMRNTSNKVFLSFSAPKEECPEFAARVLSNDVLPLVAKSKGIYVSTKTENRKKVSVCLAKLLTEQYTVLYFSFNEAGIENLAEAFQTEVLNQNPYPDIEETLKKTTDINLRIPFLSGYFRVLFNESDAPVLILENVDKLSRQERKELLPRLLDFWSCFRFVLIGDKMGNEFSNLTEYELDETL
jgi:transcriptional regulator with AAA-type ATPase domain